MTIKITYDPSKRDSTLSSRGIDFADTVEIFAGSTLDFQDTRKDYVETRMITIGYLRGRMNGGCLDSPWQLPPYYLYEESK